MKNPRDGNLLLVVLLCVSVPRNVNGAINCPSSGVSGSKDNESIFDYGDPVMFVTTSSQKYDPYSLVDVHRRTSVMDEYLMVGYHPDTNGSDFELVESLQMVLYDGVKQVDTNAIETPDLVHQNLEKELYWKFVNSTGILPFLTIVNTTERFTLKFETNRLRHDDPNDIAFKAALSVRDFHLEPQVPYSAIFEVPANARVLRNEKTLIQYQSFSLWRWRLSEKVIGWSNISDLSEFYEENTLTSNFHRIDNPCIKDMCMTLQLLVYVPRSNKTANDDGLKNKLVYLASPLIQSHLGEDWFYDMKTEQHPWWPEAPEKIVLTNDHLVVLTKAAIWVSNSLNDSSNPAIDLEMVGNYTDRPNLTYAWINPCENFKNSIDCFLPSKNSTDESNENETQKYTIERLLYTPVCYLYQFPFYDDYLIFIVERQTVSAEESISDFTVMFARKPYMEWRILFSNVALYKMFVKNTGQKTKTRHTPIKKIISIFFNHHAKHFDVTLELYSTSPRYQRFVIPEPTTVFDGYGELLTKEQLIKARARHSKGLRELNSTFGRGFAEANFPVEFEMEDVVVNGDTLDVLFIGNQVWIAEAGSSSVYAALSGVSPVNDSVCDPSPSFNKSRIKECSFNHPDKTYICTNEDRRLIFAGKPGARYTPSVIRTDYIEEFVTAQKVNPWVTSHFCDLLQTKSVFVSSFSGKILFWYIHEPDIEAKTAENEINSGCTQSDKKSVICDEINEWKSKGCKAEPGGNSGFRLLVIHPSRLDARKQNTDGPLVPFLVDANTAVLYEGIVPTAPDRNSYDYFSDVFVGQTIFCNNYDLKNEEVSDDDQQHTCQLFIRHIKPVENYLDGFRRCIYVTIVKSIPILAVPTDVVVLALPRSNKALVKINDYINDPAWVFTKDHIGQTIYFPGNFSMLLAGFPVENDATIMEGYTTSYFQHQRRWIFRAFFAFLMDMSTQVFRGVETSISDERIRLTKLRWNISDTVKYKLREVHISVRERIQAKWNKSYDPTGGTKVSLFRGNVEDFTGREQEEQDLLKVTEIEKHNVNGQPNPWVPMTPPSSSDLFYGQVEYKDRLIWYLTEKECHFILTLANHPVLITSGGRISLDKYDRISFEVLLRPTTPLGKLLMYRPLIVVTNSNPNILRVEVIEKLKGNPQFIQFLLSPTGFRTGVAVITVRSRVSSLFCPQSSITFIILCHRDVGRRLHVNYPIPTCKPEEKDGLYARPWYKEVEGCITNEELLDPSLPEILRYTNNKRLVAYVSLPPNYRPPSFDGTDIPQSRNTYNADPSKPAYKSWYRISRQSIELNRCAGKSVKRDCQCSDADRLLDDEELSECKEKVFATKRTGTGEAITMSVSYDRIMRDQDQNPELFIPKRNWSITIEEVNSRGEWYIISDYTPYLEMINTNIEQHQGRRYYDMNRFQVTLLGTGLFHFKVKLGRVESFDTVTGYFILYASTDDINHVHLFMILLGTIIICMTMVFVGFLANGKRLSSMLPIQPMSHKRKLKLL